MYSMSKFLLQHTEWTSRMAENETVTSEAIKEREETIAQFDCLKQAAEEAKHQVLQVQFHYALHL